MKRWVWILLIVLVVLLTPIPVRAKDGGTVKYTAITYKVTKWHAFAFQEGVEGYNIGTEVQVLGFTVYDDTAFVPGEQVD